MSEFILILLYHYTTTTTTAATAATNNNNDNNLCPEGSITFIKWKKVVIACTLL